MHITPTSFTIADYCQSMIRKEIIVNRDYQRSDKVWPAAARSFLIETILLGYPIPKLYLYQVTDLKSRKTIKHIVDGQQRSFTILDFYQNKFKLSRTSELDDLKGKGFEDLPVEYQQKFIDYAVPVDLFVSATEEEIREVFRRMNSYTVPLNAEEKRHSQWQGEFKWFIYKLSKKYDQPFINIGVFNDKQLIRMSDAKLFSEITHAFLNGITTTTSPNLDKLYKDYDDDFPQSKSIEKRISQSINTILGWDELHNTALMRPHLFYALILAVSHIQNPVEEFFIKYEPTNQNIHPNAQTNLSALADALENEDNAPKKFQDFVEASARTTNDVRRRSVIFKLICKAIELEKI
ncbi:MAG: DUF262 domain-containing protein [Anaerolineae bacterium]|nr:DUF262 domain-containing protein [Anaerolineae bacterium]